MEVESGVYPGQTISADESKAAALAPVVFRPAAGARVRVAAPLYVFASHITLARLHVQSVTIGNYDQTPGRPDPTGVTLQNLTGRNFEIDSATRVTIRGGSWGPASACGGPYGGGNNSIRQPTATTPSDITIDHVRIHDVQSHDLVECHIEGLAIFAGRNVTVSNSRFYGNSVYDVFVQNNNPAAPPISGLTIAGNWMAAPVGLDGRQNGTVIGFSGVSSNVLLADNRFNYVLSLDADGSRPAYSNFKVTGNVGVLPYYGCGPLHGISWSRNVWRRAACSASDVNLHGTRL
ncbi:MAG TPA: hypothetical protein VLJ42_03595, partial [Solirubrobacteraceae bacterium]|nr:hypothetical protein [Solirubrobacteraceae bacterium]